MHSDPFGLVGSVLSNRYRVEAVVAEGGFSVVYRARHTLWGRAVALKAFRVVDIDDEARARMFRAFVQEGAILADLSERTTAIVQARDIATCVTPAGEWIPYMVLEWLDGASLESVLWRERREGRPPRGIAEAVKLLDPIAEALGLAHAQGICHRDLKPGNIFVLGDARSDVCKTKLLDFGIAAVSGTALGPSVAFEPTESYAFTPSYGAPEQFGAAYGVTGPWTDIFALSLIVVELVAGREPLGRGAPEELGHAATDPVRRPTLRGLGVAGSAPVEAVLARALAVRPSDRYVTVQAFWLALRQAIAESERGPDPPRARASRSALWHAALGIVVLTALLATAASRGMTQRIRHMIRPILSADSR